jgi:hypothetical protein
VLFPRLPVYSSVHFRRVRPPVTGISGLPISRRRPNAAKISLTTVSNELGTYPLRVSRLERGLDHDREFAERYQAWLRSQIAA